MRQIQIHLPAKHVWIGVVLLLMLGPVQVARAVVVPWVGSDLGNWNDENNWEDGALFGLPNAANNEAAAINNGSTAVLSATASTNIAGLFLGQGSSDVGGLNITNGGSLMSIAGSTETGALSIGGAGQGSLTILGGGSLSGTTLSLAGNVASSILLGDTSGLTASLSTSGNATLGRTTQVTGPTVDFDVGGNLTLNSSSMLISQISSSTLHSPLKSAGTASVGGTLKVEFISVTPMPNNSWNIIDAATINGSFANLDTSAAPALPSGQLYTIRQTTGGTYGQLLQLSVAQVLTLQINRDTGAATIANAGADPITIDGYSILSPFGALDSGDSSWSSLEDQSEPGWLESDPTPTDLSELHPNAGGLTLNGSQSKALGTPYSAAFPAFGVDPDDIQFEYSTPDGDIFEGLVEYSGSKVNNNLILSVDPSTGQAQLKNDSPFTVEIDAYQVHSDHGSLQAANGDWFSLEDRGITGWEESAPDANLLTELNADGGLTLTPFSGYDLGELYDSVSGMQDLELQFLMVDNPTLLDGMVVYGAFGPVDPPVVGLPGDYNGNDVIDAADYTVWRDAVTAGLSDLPNRSPSLSGLVGEDDFLFWRNHFGETAGSGAGGSALSAPVPEPSTFVMMLFAALAAAFPRRRSRPASSLLGMRTQQ